MLGGGLHPSILALEPPAPRGPVATVVSAQQRAKQNRLQSWGRPRPSAPPAAAPCEDGWARIGPEDPGEGCDGQQSGGMALRQIAEKLMLGDGPSVDGLQTSSDELDECIRREVEVPTLKTGLNTCEQELALLTHKISMSRAFEEHEASMVELMSLPVIDSLVREGQIELATKLVMLQMKPYHTLALPGSLPPLKSIETCMRCVFEAMTPTAVAAHVAAAAAAAARQLVFGNNDLMHCRIFPAVLGAPVLEIGARGLVLDCTQMRLPEKRRALMSLQSVCKGWREKVGGLRVGPHAQRPAAHEAEKRAVQHMQTESRGERQDECAAEGYAVAASTEVVHGVPVVDAAPAPASDAPDNSQQPGGAPAEGEGGTTDQSKKPPPETRTYYVCPKRHGPKGFAWRGTGRERHHERCPDCPWQPFGVSYKPAEVEAHVETVKEKAWQEEGMDDEEVKPTLKRARNAFFSKLAEDAIADWRAGRGRAMLCRGEVVEEAAGGEDGGGLHARNMWVVVPPGCKPGDTFDHNDHRGIPIKLHEDGYLVSGKGESVWEGGAINVPDPRPQRAMPITVWSRAPRASEKAKAAEKAAEAEERRKAAEAEDAEWDAAFAEAGYWDDEGDEGDEHDEDDPPTTAPAAPAAASTAPTEEPAGPSAAATVGSTEPATATPGTVEPVPPSGMQQQDSDGRIEAAVKAAREAAVEQAKQEGKSTWKQTQAGVQAGVRARWYAVVRKVLTCGDLRATFKLSDADYAAQRSACKKAYSAAKEARRSAGGEVPSEQPIHAEREYTAITCGWKACNGHAARDFKLIVGSALLKLIIAEGKQSLDIIVVKTVGSMGNYYCLFVYAAPCLCPIVVHQSTAATDALPPCPSFVQDREGRGVHQRRGAVNDR